MKKILVGLVLGILFITNSAFAKCKDVTIAQMNWASGEIVASVAKFLIENGYDCNVALIPSSTIPAVTSVAEKGKPDIILELWENSAPVYKKLKAQGKVVTAASIFSQGGLEAWWIPEYLAKQHPELTTLEGIMANPDKVKGRFHNCPTGWGCRTINDNNIKAIGLRNKLEIFDHGSGETLTTSIASAYSNKEPWFGYHWGPTAILGKYKMVQVDVGDYVKENHDCNIKDDCTNPKPSAYPASSVISVLTTTFEKSNPDVANLIKNMTYDNQLVNELLAWQEDTGSSADETAAFFLTNNKEVWSSWLNADARKKLSKIL